jgi:hypothetical protein
MEANILTRRKRVPKKAKATITFNLTPISLFPRFKTPGRFLRTRRQS